MLNRRGDVVVGIPKPLSFLQCSNRNSFEGSSPSQHRCKDCNKRQFRQRRRRQHFEGNSPSSLRRPDLVARLQVFEVDHPTTQAMKRQRIALPGWDVPPQLHFVPLDFTQESLTSALGRSSYDPHQLTFLSWLGVTYYLTREVIFATLDALRNLAPAGSTLVFDYMDSDSFIPERAARRTQLMHGTARRVGEPMKTGFDPLGLGDELKGAGFRLQENLSPADIEQRYFQGRSDQYHAFEHVHFAKAVIA